MRRHNKPKESAAPVFAALGDENRLRLLSRLCDSGPLSITQLTDGSNITRQAITKHLRVMGEAGIVRCAVRGRESMWQLEHRRLEDAQRYLHQISEEWDRALARLQSFVEE